MIIPEEVSEGFIYYGPGTCVDCAGPIYVVDTESMVFSLDSEGNPISDYSVFKCRGVCANCGKKINMMRWDEKYVPYSNSSYILKELERVDIINDRINDMKANNIKNPFNLKEND